MHEIEYEIVELLRSDLYSHMRFFALPLGMLETGFDPNIKIIGTDGEKLIFDPDWLKRSFASDNKEALIFILHELYHCIFSHPFGLNNRDFDLWQLACDITVWYLIDITSGELASELSPLCKEAGAICRLHMEIPTAEGIYELLESGVINESCDKFCLDDHSMWKTAKIKEEKLLINKSFGPGEGGNGEESIKERWQNISKKVLASLPAVGKKAGRGTKSLRRSIKLGTVKRYKYSDFLRRFSVFREENRPNMDEFQYSYYVYGLEHYGNVPIIEPLEYREEHRLDELVIVIDTSGSCSRELTQMFLEETRNIISVEDLFFRRFNLHIIQCDSKVQRDDKITSLDEFNDYILNLEIIGQGGTDYRPAFEHIEKLRQIGELPRLKGILYFTDGYGHYPREMPDYESAFIFIKHRYDDIDVPNWALKLVLDAELPKESLTSL